ncbi:MAG: hypothetical protein ABFQ89_00895, partial [Chloroflexota bacterium]
QVDSFVDLPFQLYADNKYWVPPIVSEARATLDRSKNPFFHHSDANFILAYENNRPVGRLAVMENRQYNQHHGTRTAFFYLFECMDDSDIAEALFDHAKEWARVRDLNVLIGSKGFLQGDGMGILVEGFSHLPAMGIPYNHSYYGDLIEHVGFDKETDFLSGYLEGSHQLPDRIRKVAERVKRRRGYTVKSFRSARELRKWVQRIGEVYTASFTENWEYCPPTPAELEVIGDRLITIANPKLIKLVLKDDQIIGFVFGFMDVSCALQRTKGKIWPFGWLLLMREFNTTRVVNFNGVGMLPGYQGLGGSAVMYAEMAHSMREVPIDIAEVVQVEERNHKSLGDMQALGVKFHKRHRIYRLKL